MKNIILSINSISELVWITNEWKWMRFWWSFHKNCETSLSFGGYSYQRISMCQCHKSIDKNLNDILLVFNLIFTGKWISSPNEIKHIAWKACTHNRVQVFYNCFLLWKAITITVLGLHYCFLYFTLPFKFISFAVPLTGPLGYICHVMCFGQRNVRGHDIRRDCKCVLVWWVVPSLWEEPS